MPSIFMKPFSRKQKSALEIMPYFWDTGRGITATVLK
jgi:hypothetical protein